MRVLVTGTTGFIGSHITEALVNKGHEVIGVSRNISDQKISNLRYAKLDAVNKDELISKLNDSKIDAIVNCIGILGKFGLSDSTYFEINVQATKNLLEFARLKKVEHFIHLSSCGVVGPIEQSKCPADENYPPSPSNIYEKTKLLAEEVVKTSGVNYTILRPEFVYGPDDMHLLGFFKSINSGFFILIDGGESYLHPTYIDDVTFSVMQVLSNPHSYKKVFNICGERYVQVKTLIKIVSDSLNKEIKMVNVPSYILLPLARAMGFLNIFRINPPLTVSRVKFFSENRAFSYGNAKNLINYRPTVMLEEGIERTVRWYLKYGYL